MLNYVDVDVGGFLDIYLSIYLLTYLFGYAYVLFTTKAYSLESNGGGKEHDIQMASNEASVTDCQGCSRSFQYC